MTTRLTIDEAADLIYGVKPDVQDYEARHETALSRYHDDSRVLRKMTPYNDGHERADIERILAGETEEVQVERAPVVVRRKFVVPVDDPAMLAYIFRHGAYSEDDAMAKYGFSRSKLSGNFEEHDVDVPDITKCARYTLTLAGTTTRYYPKEHLDHVMERQWQH